MSDTWFYVKKIIAIIIFIAVLSMMGVATGKTWMIFAYAAFFILVVAGVILIESYKRRHFEVKTAPNPLFRKILGGFMLFLALGIPVLITTRMSLFSLPNLPVSILLLASLGVTVVFIGLMTAAVYLINNLNKIIGYALIVVASILPGLIISFFDRSTTGIGSVYYIFLAVVILSYSGINLLVKHD